MKMTLKEEEVHLREVSQTCSYKVQEYEIREGQPSCTALRAVEGSVKKEAYKSAHFFFFNA